jgi:hypothetical protein
VLGFRKPPVPLAKPEVIRGTVSNLFYWNFKHNAALSLNAQRVNETNGDNSVDEMRKAGRKMIFGGVAGILAGLAVLITGGIALYREPSFLSSGGVGRIAIYLVSAVGSLALGTISLFFLSIGALAEGNVRKLDDENRKGAPPK